MCKTHHSRLNWPSVAGRKLGINPLCYLRVSPAPLEFQAGQLRQPPVLERVMFCCSVSLSASVFFPSARDTVFTSGFRPCLPCSLDYLDCALYAGGISGAPGEGCSRGLLQGPRCHCFWKCLARGNAHPSVQGCGWGKPGGICL